MSTPIIKGELVCQTTKDTTDTKMVVDEKSNTTDSTNIQTVVKETSLSIKTEYKDQASAEAVFDDLVAELQKRGLAIGHLSFHLCSHSAGEPEHSWRHCKDDPQSAYREVKI